MRPSARAASCATSRSAALSRRTNARVARGDSRSAPAATAARAIGRIISRRPAAWAARPAETSCWIDGCCPDPATVREQIERLLQSPLGQGAHGEVWRAIHEPTSSPVAVKLLHGGRVYGYQSGFCYEADSKRKPGLVSHYLAIEHNIAAGAGVYDFMAERGQHKGSLSSVQEDMAWITLQRRRPVLRLERGLKGLRRWWLDRKAPADGEAPPAG